MSEQAIELLQQAARARWEDRLADARDGFQAALAVSRNAGAAREQVQALKGLAQIERDLGRPDAARPLYEEAVAIARTLDDELLLAHTVRHLGDLYLDCGGLEAAEPCYVEAVALYRRHPATPPLDLANALRPFAILKERTGDRVRSAGLWAEARDLYAQVNVQEGVAEAVRRMERLEREPPAGGEPGAMPGVRS